MNFIGAVRTGFENYANFSGRATRPEYWYWVLFAFLTGMVSGLLDGYFFGIRDVNDTGPVMTVMRLMLMIPGLSVSVRRLHDIDKSGWWFLIGFTIIGMIPLVYWFCKEGDDRINRFGAPPVENTKRKIL
jgi:uncharacterized membrane protein YhaH (DUF805 family)